MIRMTLLLVFGIAAAMMIYGEDTGLSRATSLDAPAVTRSDTGTPGLLTRVEDLIETATGPVETTENVPLKDERRAIEIALAATLSPEPPAAPAPDTARIDAAADAPQSSATIWYVTGNSVNLRGGPSTGNAVVGRVRLGQQAEVTEKTANGWYRIRTADEGQDGYIFGRFLSQNRPG